MGRCRNTGLYVTSRTLFALAQKYGTPYIKNTLGRTSAGGTPTAAILFCSIFGCIAFLALADQSYDQTISTLSSFYVGGGACVYGSECIAFIRYKKGLDTLKKDNTLSRDDPPYTTKYYRAHWQPLCAYFGLLCFSLLVLFSGWAAVYILSARRKLGSNDSLKSNEKLAADLIGSYAGPIIFFTLYITYKCIRRTKIIPIENLDDDLYLTPDLPYDDSERVELRSWRDWVKEIWGLIK